MNVLQAFGIKVFLSMLVILINLLALPIAIYLLFAYSPGTVISNWDITLSVAFLLVCNIITLQLILSKGNWQNKNRYAGFALAFLQIMACCLYMSLHTLTAYILFAATIILSLILLIKTVRKKDPAFR